MSTPATTVPETMTVREAAHLMQARNIGALPVVNAAGELVGVLSEGDFTGMARCIPFTLDLAPVIFGHRAATPEELLRIYAQAADLPVKQVMSTPGVSIGENAPVGEAVKRLLDKEIKHLPVVANRKVVGMLSRHDLLKLLARI